MTAAALAALLSLVRELIAALRKPDTGATIRLAKQIEEMIENDPNHSAVS